MTVIPCGPNQDLRDLIEQYAEVLRTQAHLLGNHGLTEREFYESGVFRGAIELLRGQFSADKSQKREFIRHVLNYMEDCRHITGWEQLHSNNRQDYEVTLNSGNTAIIVTKGCLDGNNTTIFERPADTDELIIWSLCTNVGADMRHNAWSGIHTRLRPDRTPSVDGIVIWDMLCGSPSRPCPKLARQPDPSRVTAIGPFQVPPPCVYVFPRRDGDTNADLACRPRVIRDVEILTAFHDAFQGFSAEVNQVQFAAMSLPGRQNHQTRVIRDGVVVKDSHDQRQSARD